MAPMFRLCGRFLTSVGLFTLVFVWVGNGSRIVSQEDQNPGPASPSLGVSKMLEQVVLPGSLLTHRKVDPKTTPLIVRVVRSFPHGDAYRYDISYFGLTPGTFDLRDFLVREDGSSTDDLPPLPVTVSTILDEGQIEPNELEVGSLSRFGGYWQLLLLGSIVWVVILLTIIFVGRKRKEIVEVAVEKKVTLAELLQPSIEQAMSGTLPKEKHAELERLLFGFWQKKLHLSDLDPAAALNQIRSHEQSGPLMKQVELWLHSPAESGADIDLAKLLAPYREFDADDFETHRQSAGAEAASSEARKDVSSMTRKEDQDAPSAASRKNSGAGQ